MKLASSSSRPDCHRRVRVLNISAALLILVGGYVHFDLYHHGYRSIPKIGVAFLLQALSSGVVAGLLMMQSGRVRRASRHIRTMTAQIIEVGGIALNLGTLGALALAHTPRGLLNFRERGLLPAPETLIAILAESAAAALLIVALIDQGRGRDRLDDKDETDTRVISGTFSAAEVGTGADEVA